MWARALVLGAVMLGTGAVSHASAGGRLPHPVALLVLTAALVVLAGRFLLGPASTRRIVVLVVVGQGLAHTTLSALAGHRGDGSTASPRHLPAPTASLPVDADGRRVGSLLDAYAGAHAMPGHDGPGVPTAPLTHLLHHLADQGALMLAAHLAAAVVLGLVLAVGERALWALLHLAAARVVVLAPARRSTAATLAVLRGTAAAPRPRPRSAGFTPIPRLDRPALSHRGPPVLLAA